MQLDVLQYINKKYINAESLRSNQLVKTKQFLLYIALLFLRSSTDVLKVLDVHFSSRFWSFFKFQRNNSNPMENLICMSSTINSKHEEFTFRLLALKYMDTFSCCFLRQLWDF